MRKLLLTIAGLAMVFGGGRIALDVIQMLSSDALAMALGLGFGILASLPMMMILASERRDRTTHVTHHHVHRIEQESDWRVVSDPPPLMDGGALPTMPVGQGRKVRHEIP